MRYDRERYKPEMRNPYPETFEIENWAKEYFEDATAQGMPADYYDDEMVTTMFIEGHIKPNLALINAELGANVKKYDDEDSALDDLSEYFRDGLPPRGRASDAEYKQKCIDWANNEIFKHTNYQIDDLILDMPETFTSHGFAWKLMPKQTPAPKKKQRRYTSMFNIIANPSDLDYKYEIGPYGSTFSPLYDIEIKAPEGATRGPYPLMQTLKYQERLHGKTRCEDCFSSIRLFCNVEWRDEDDNIMRSNWTGCMGCDKVLTEPTPIETVIINPRYFDEDGDVNAEQMLLDQMIAKEYEDDDMTTYEVEIRYDNGSKAEFVFADIFEAVRYFAKMAVANNANADFFDADESDKKLAEAVFVLWSEISPNDRRVVSVKAEEA